MPNMIGDIYGEDTFSEGLYSWEASWQTTGVTCDPVTREPVYTPPPVADWQPVTCAPLVER